MMDAASNTDKAVFLIVATKSLDVAKQPRLHSELHSASNYGRDDLADEHGTVRDHHVVIRKTYILLYCAFSCFFMLLVLFEGKKVTL